MTFLFLLHNWGDVGLLVLRLALAAVFFVHGKSKIPMWKMQASEQMPMSMIKLMRFLSVVEILGSVAMVLGLFEQIAALGFMLIMAGAMYFKIFKWKVPFMGKEKLGWELDLMVFAAAASIYFIGAGIYSLDFVLLGL